MPGFPIRPVVINPVCPGGSVGGGITLADVFRGFYARWVIPDYGQTAFWLQRITEGTPGRVNAAGFDPDRFQETVLSDQTYGVGWFAPFNGVMYGGFFPRGNFACGINDTAKIEEYLPDGVSIYEGPVVIYQPPIDLGKGDVIVVSDGRRFIIEDRVAPAQVHGNTILRTDKLIATALDNPVYSIPIAP